MERDRKQRTQEDKPEHLLSVVANTTTAQTRLRDQTFRFLEVNRDKLADPLFLHGHAE